MNNESRLNGEREGKALAWWIPATHMLHVAKLVNGSTGSSWARRRHSSGRGQPGAA